MCSYMSKTFMIDLGESGRKMDLVALNTLILSRNKVVNIGVEYIFGGVYIWWSI